MTDLAYLRAALVSAEKELAVQRARRLTKWALGSTGLTIFAWLLLAASPLGV